MPHLLQARPLLACCILGLAACSQGDQAAPAKQQAQRLQNNEIQAGSTAAAAGSTRDAIIFRGICDGSAAVSLGGTAILVACDELNTLFAFDQGGGKPTARKELAALLNLETSDEIDIEAATVSGERIWWLGSHGLDSGGKDAPNRRMLFATNVPSPDLEDLQLITPPLDLTDILLNSAEVAQVLTDSARKRPPKEGGVSIEGLATSADGGLLVGFRSPLTAADGMSGKALLVNLLPVGDSFEVQQAYLLDLEDRGVRGIVNDSSGYLIIAGRVASGGKYALFRWKGDSTPAQQTMPLDGLNAESVLDLGNHWLILSDDGKVMHTAGEQRCDRIRRKDKRGETHPDVFFRARLIPK
jgi:hypothetical protein